MFLSADISRNRLGASLEKRTLDQRLKGSVTTDDPMPEYMDEVFQKFSMKFFSIPNAKQLRNCCLSQK